MLPDGWENTRLGAVCQIATGGTPNRAVPEYWNGDIPWMSSGEINQRIVRNVAEHITAQGMANSNARRLPTGTVMMALNGQGKTRGKVALLEIETTCNQSLAGLIADRTRLLPDYLFYSLDAQYQDIRNITGDDARNGLNLGILRALTIALPPLDEQRRIAEVLRSVDNAIAATDAVITGLKSAASEVAERAFPDPDNIELELEIATFGDLFDIKGGNQPPKSSFIYQPKDGYVRLLQIRDFESDDRAAYISEKSTNVRCGTDDILIARYGASVGRILTGKAGAYNVALTKVVFRGRKVLRRYAYHWLKSEYFQDRISAVSNRSAQAGFNKEDLFPTKIALPPLAKQADVAEALDDIERAMLANRIERQQMIEVKAALLNDLLSGHVRVPA